MNPAILAIATAALTSANGEQLSGPALPGFVGGYEAADPHHDMAIREQVPQGQTVEQWSRMVTTQRFGGLALRIEALAFAQTLGASMAANCPGARETRPSPATVSGHPAVRLEVACPRVPSTGQPETMLMLAIAGDSDLHVKQVAFRGGATAGDLAWGRRYLAGVTLCRPSPAAPTCAN